MFYPKEEVLCMLKLASEGLWVTFCSCFFWEIYFKRGKCSKSCLSLACWSWSIPMPDLLTTLGKLWTGVSLLTEFCLTFYLVKSAIPSNFLKTSGAPVDFFGVRNSTNFYLFSVSLKVFAGNCFKLILKASSYFYFFIFSMLISSRMEVMIGLFFFGVATLLAVMAMTL